MSSLDVSATVGDVSRDVSKDVSDLQKPISLDLKETLNEAGLLGSSPDATDLLLKQLTAKNSDAGGIATQAMTPDVRAAINKGASVVKQAAPVLALVQMATSGKEPSPMAVISAMSGAIGMANPVAGAIVFAMGSIMAGMAEAANGIFVSFGLQHVLPTDQHVIGRLIVEQMPTPRTPVVNEAGDDISYDPLWVHWDELVRLEPIHDDRNAWHNDTTFASYLHLMRSTDLGSAIRPKADPVMWRLLSALAPKQPENSELHWVAYPETCHLPTPTSDFERFFYPMLKKTMEHWANGSAYMDPRDLLDRASMAWNQLHEPGAKVVYRAMEAKSTSIVSYIQSGLCDIKGGNGRGKDIPIHAGPLVQAPEAAHAAVVTRMSNATYASLHLRAHVAVSQPSARGAALLARSLAAFRALPPLPSPKALVAAIPSPKAIVSAVAASKGPSAPAPISKRPAHPSTWSIGETIVAVGAVGGVVALALRDEPKKGKSHGHQHE